MMNSCSKKLMGSEGNNMDRLSSLPESVRVRILSFLPAIDAARTILLRPFGDLWRNIDILDFDDSPFLGPDNLHDPTQVQQFIRLVRYFLMLHKGSKINKFRVKFFTTLETMSDFFAEECPELEEKNLIMEVNMWLKFALGKGVEVLDLDFGLNDDESTGKVFSLPHFVWASRSLVELRLRKCDLGFPRSYQTHLLRVLELNSVGVSTELLHYIICGSPLLQDLTITDCSELINLWFTASNIRTLHVNNNLENSQLFVDCPNLRSFEFSGSVGRVELTNLSSLKVAAFNLKMDRDRELKEFLPFKRFLEMTQHVEVLKLNTEAFAVFTVTQNYPFRCNNWRRVVLTTPLNRNYISGIWSLLRNSFYLEELIINIARPRYIPKVIRSVLENSSHEGTSNWSFAFLIGIPNLKNVTMNGARKASMAAQINLVKAFLQDAVGLDRFCFSAKQIAQDLEKFALTSEELFEISKKLLTFPRASKQATVFLT